MCMYFSFILLCSFICTVYVIRHKCFVFFNWTYLPLVTVMSSFVFYCVPNVLFSKDVNVHCLVCNLLNKMSEMNQTV